jgi:peroxiredoxin
MARTESTMLPIGTMAPVFILPDTVSGQLFSLNDLRSETATVVMFICNHCPYVLHVKDEVVRLAKEYQAKGIAFVAISSNDAEQYPQDGPEAMKVFAQDAGFTFPYLYDETQEVARAYEAACTPDFYVFDGALNLRYRGRLDESRPKTDNPKPVTGSDLRGALNALLANQLVSEIQYPSIGCNIKWKQ